eukprot:3127554-Amphidinium_carterae.1
MDSLKGEGLVPYEQCEPVIFMFVMVWSLVQSPAPTHALQDDIRRLQEKFLASYESTQKKQVRSFVRDDVTCLGTGRRDTCCSEAIKLLCWEASVMSNVRDIPPTAGVVIWVKQLERRLSVYMKRVEEQQRCCDASCRSEQDTA